jgi:hypothetical protein
LARATLLGPGGSGVGARRRYICVGFCTISCIKTTAGDGVRGGEMDGSQVGTSGAFGDLGGWRAFKV